jgi:glycosyltransferase involved in cell wall biosynthesis
MTWPIKILVVSSVTPKPTGFGEITLYRHLAGEPKLAVEVVPFPGIPKPLRLLRRTALRGLAESIEVMGQGHRWDAKARTLAESVKPQLLLTEAAGDGYHAAIRLARATGIPLLARFSDWWPDLVPGRFRAGEEARFRELYRVSKIALCVSDGMKAALGEHPDSRLLWPIPSSEKVDSQEGSSGQNWDGKIFRICYSGNLREYAPMLQKILQVMKAHPSLRLEVRGMNPRWPTAFLQEMRRLDLYHEFAPREELERWLASADAFLVTSAFEPGMRRLMETNFPSKILEFARFGKPLVCWGPDYSTLIRWAQPESRALCVTESDPENLCLALKKLAASRNEQQRLANEAKNATRGDFDPEIIQNVFLHAVQDAVYKDRRDHKHCLVQASN